jgi:hypothetical protein
MGKGRVTNEGMGIGRVHRVTMNPVERFLMKRSNITVTPDPRYYAWRSLRSPRRGAVKSAFESGRRRLIRWTGRFAAVK